jgi:CRP-like cAMP-binding protein
MTGSTIPNDTKMNELYAVLPLEARQELEKHEQLITVSAGTSLIKHGVLPKGLVILTQGTVEISVPCSRRPTSMSITQPGKVFGMRAAITGELPEIDVTCLEPCCITFLPRNIFLDLLTARPEMYFAVAKVLSADLQMANQILSSTARRYSALRTHGAL